MSGIFKYSGLTTKVRAMRAGLIKGEQLQRLAELGTVSELVEMLKGTRAYEDIFRGVDSSEVHRGELEKLMMYSKYRDFAKIYRFANLEQRRYMKLYSVKYEVDVLKQAIVHADSRYRAEFSNGYDKIPGKYPDIDIEKVCAGETIDDIVEATRGTIFYKSLSTVQAFEKPTEFDYEVALDLFFFGYVWEKRTKLFKGSELKSVTVNFGTEADTLNIMWLHRIKRYYKLPPEKIYTMVIPVYYKLRKSQIKELVESENENEFLEVLEQTYYGRYLHEQEYLNDGNVGKVFAYHLEQCYHKLFKHDPYSLSAINAYLQDKEAEIKKLVTIAECIRYQYPAEEILKQI